MGRKLLSKKFGDTSSVNLMNYLAALDASRLSPNRSTYVDGAIEVEKIRVRFEVPFNEYGVENVIEFSVSMEESFGIQVLIRDLYSGCMIVDFNTFGKGELERFYGICKNSDFSFIARRYSIALIDFLSGDRQGEVLTFQ